ncbi:pyruvate dehydrogenase (acetyl-transferring) E1 component subunit alpha [Microbacterium sp. G2-8]|uniref:pyruvate dehydrogenase (acetyl-transferring) E1 component subunit alpha n=1 Tax=Microbacterium sp. G2-8 TaxID=2842454 RepID=UPI001C8A7A4C|nr:pyruvate dehydrogenase (acetyl-transferring) E1 component subunit alpha [Microbacterium sp. G2-8]
MHSTTDIPVPAQKASGFLQLIDPDGHRVGSAEERERVRDLDHDALRGLLEDMRIIRRIDEEGTALQRHGELGIWPPVRGQEAAQIASARMLRAEDFVFSTYREHGVAYCRGAEPTDLARAWRGVTFCGWDPNAIRMAAGQVIIGAHALHATGYAMGIAWDGDDSAAIAYLGDGAMSEGDVSEAMVFAASFRVPVIFFVQNNQWAISEPVTLQSRVPLSERGSGFGIPAIRVDGNDVLAVASATRTALERARTGGGPTLIEAVTYRMGPHTTADDPTRYRADDEVAAWEARDPILRLERLLDREGALPDGFDERVTARGDALAGEMRAGCTALSDPTPESLFSHVYAEPHADMDAQREALVAYLDGLEEAPR